MEARLGKYVILYYYKLFYYAILYYIILYVMIRILLCSVSSFNFPPLTAIIMMITGDMLLYIYMIYIQSLGHTD